MSEQAYKHPKIDLTGCGATARVVDNLPPLEMEPYDPRRTYAAGDKASVALGYGATVYVEFVKVTPAVEAPAKSKWGKGRSRNTRSFSLSDELFDRMKRYTHAKGVSLSDVAEITLLRAMNRAEEANGGPFPPIPVNTKGDLSDL